MFIEFFDWFCSCLETIFNTMKKFVLFDDFTFYHLCMGLLAIPILIKIIQFIMGIEDEEGNIQPGTAKIKPQYDSNGWNKYNNKPIVAYSWYKPRHRAQYRDEYIPRHTMKGRHGK